MRSDAWKLYWAYWRLFAIIFFALYLIAGLSVFVSQPDLPLAEIGRRALLAGLVAIAIPFAAALVPILVPMLWFWPWMRKGRVGKDCPGR